MLLRKGQTLLYFLCTIILTLSLQALANNDLVCPQGVPCPKKVYFIPDASIPDHQITSWNFDWDDNIMFMPTEILVFNKDTGDSVGIPTNKWAIIRDKVGLAGAGSYIDAQGKSHNLENYVVDGARGSYKNFRGPQFLDDIKKALASDPKAPGYKAKWQARSWEAFVTALSHESTALWTTIITARGHAPEEIMAGLQYLKDMGYIKYLPPLENIKGVSGKEFAGDPADPSQIKAKILLDVLDGLQSVQLYPDLVPVTNQDGDGHDVLHLWGFSDDDMGNFKAAVDVISQNVYLKNPDGSTTLDAAGKSVSRWPHIKIVLYYTGEHIADDQPRSVVIKSDGSTRPFLKREQNESHVVFEHFKCSQLFKQLGLR